MDRIDFQAQSAVNVLETFQYWQASTRLAFAGLLSFFNDQGTSFFVSGSGLTSTPGDGVVTEAVTAGWAAHNGEIIAVQAGSIVRTVSEVAWLEPNETFVDATPPLNAESVGTPMQVQRRMVLAKGSNFPAQGSYLMLDESINQLVFMENKLRSGLLRVKAGFFWFGLLSNFDDTGLGIVGTDAQGLALSNGNNGTVDMRGLAPVGAGLAGNSAGAGPLPAGVVSTYALNSLFGAENVTLTIPQIPAHDHDFQGTNVEFTSGSGALQNGDGHTRTYLTKTTELKGGGASHENRQPSRAILFVQRVS